VLFYSVAGLCVGSEVPLAGLAPLSEPVDAAAMIRLGDVPGHLPGAILVGPNWMISEAQLLIWIPGLARFMLTDGQDIRIRPVPGRPAEEALAFLPQMLGLLLQQRGRTVLRSSAVEVGGWAILFCGDSGAGKSTFATALAERQHRLLGDDFCVIDVTTEGALIVHGDAARPKLWADAIDAFDQWAETGDAVRCNIQKYHVGPPTSPADGLPLGGIYRLRDDRRLDRPVIEPLRGMDAVQTIRQSVYGPRFVDPSRGSAGILRSAVAIARTAQVFSLTRGSGFGWMEDGLRSVEESWDTSRARRDNH
jgi:hypothetical protein